MPTARHCERSEAISLVGLHSFKKIATAFGLAMTVWATILVIASIATQSRFFQKTQNAGWL
jgi:hypothetical protein